ncbi:hypothetical protein [Pedobacter sp. MC2016-24]|uniref:hypothetical protein n=1 Tax=Pedobacter sp. MC2016-24 TaxID=2780090 RepID=UPI001880D16B|nr:hypothetical protein [Pedobacter sp. MC2016-24]MBE9601081.1 hypothetical protein [Pedobacter sp. MC2016-24]
MTNVFFCLLIIAVLLFIAAKAALNVFLLTGNITGKNGQRAYLICNEQNGSQGILCSVLIQNDRFRLSYQGDQQRPVCLVIGDGEDKIKYPIRINNGHYSFCQIGNSYLFKTT